MRHFCILVIVSLALAVALSEAFPGGHEKSGKHEHGHGKGGRGGRGGHGGRPSEELTTEAGGSDITTEAPTTVSIQKRSADHGKKCKGHKHSSSEEQTTATTTEAPATVAVAKRSADHGKKGKGHKHSSSEEQSTAPTTEAPVTAVVAKRSAGKDSSEEDSSSSSSSSEEEYSTYEPNSNGTIAY